jgi:uncharacterized sulfatase
VVIDGWDKLTARPGQNELFDLKNDKDDRNDVATANEEKVAKLTDVIGAWRNRTTSYQP